MASPNETLRSNTVFDIDIPSPLPALELDGNNLWMGVIFCAYDKDKNEVLEDETGLPLIVIPQIGGTETLTPNFYRYQWLNPLDPNNQEVVDTNEQVSLGSSVMYIPLEAYTKDQAPNGQRYAVYSNNNRLRYKGEFGEFVHAVKNDLGDVSFANYPKGIIEGAFTIPEDALFLRIRDMYRPESRAFMQSPTVVRKR